MKNKLYIYIYYKLRSSYLTCKTIWSIYSNRIIDSQIRSKPIIGRMNTNTFQQYSNHALFYQSFSTSLTVTQWYSPWRRGQCMSICPVWWKIHCGSTTSSQRPSPHAWFPWPATVGLSFSVVLSFLSETLSAPRKRRGNPFTRTEVKVPKKMTDFNS